jgi:hypothetical protein
MLLGVNGTDPSIPVPDEDRVAVRDEWREHFLEWRGLEWRGRGTPEPVDIDPAGPQWLKALYKEHADDLEQAIRDLEVPAYEPAIRAGMAGDPDPQGAALALTLLGLAAGGLYEVEDRGWNALVAEHGLAFACQVMVEMIGHQVHWWPASRYRSRSARIEVPIVHHLALTNSHLRRIRPVRSLLAALPEAEYAEVREAIAQQRTSDANKFAAALLMPDQEDWVGEACDLHSGSRYERSGYDLMWAMVSTPEQAERAGARILGSYGAIDARIALVVNALGADALPILLNTLQSEDRPTTETRELLLDAISRLPSDAAVSYLLGETTNPLALAAAERAAQRFPLRALRALAAMAPNIPAASRPRLAGFARVNGLLDRVAELSETDQERIAELTRRRHPVAETVPAVYADLPWAPYAKPAKREPLVLTPPATDELRWAPGERDEWLQISEYRSYYTKESHWTSYWASVTGPEDWVFNELIAYGPEDRARPALAKWDGATDSLATGTLQAILARFGDEAAPPVMPLLKRRSSHRAAMMPFVNRDAARLAAGWLKRSNERATAKAWLDRHAADAAALLIPDAVGKDAKLAKAALDALRYLDRSVVDERAMVYGDAAAAAVAALLDADPLDPQVRVPKPAKWADPALLPQVLLADRAAALPDSAVLALMTALAIDDAERPYAGVDLLAAECDPISLAAFSWGLFELWLAAGSPSKDAWAMDQLRRFADDHAVRRLTVLIKEWPGQSQNRKSVRGLEILGGVGSEAALRAVHGIAQKAKFKALKKTATEQIEVIAERLALTLDQLGDRLVPDFGLAGDSLVLDYGPRSFTIKFDESLKPYVLDDKGKRRASAPKPNAKDDPELAPPAYERFAALRKDLKSTAAEQVKRLEAAMGSGRTWSGAEFREFLVDHPLMWHLSSRLVWQADGAAFRLAEDRTFADVEDEPFELPEDARVRLAHPLTLGDQVDEWATVFSDYEILQPFDQLARPAYELSEEERKAGKLTRFEGAKTGGGPLIGLLNRGWKFGGPSTRGGYGLYREFPEGGYVYLDSAPGVHPGYGYDNNTEQTLETVELVLPEGETIDPVAISEVLLVIARLTRS